MTILLSSTQRELTRVHFTTLDTPASDVHDLIELSREVIKANGNRTWNAPIGVVTDDISDVLSVLPEKTRAKSTGVGDKYLGYCWRCPAPLGAVLWVNPWETHTFGGFGGRATDLRRTSYAVATTLCHEVAHALAGVTHDTRWRRAFCLLLPYWLVVAGKKRIMTPDTLPYALWEAMERTTMRYRPRTESHISRDEAERNFNASERAWLQNAHRVI